MTNLRGNISKKLFPKYFRHLFKNLRDGLVVGGDDSSVVVFEVLVDDGPTFPHREPGTSFANRGHGTLLLTVVDGLRGGDHLVHFSKHRENTISKCESLAFTLRALSTIICFIIKINVASPLIIVVQRASCKQR